MWKSVVYFGTRFFFGPCLSRFVCFTARVSSWVCTVVYYERAISASVASSFEFNGKITFFAARPGPTRPDPITFFKVLYLRNRIYDRQAVFFDEYHLDVKVVWHGYHIASVPVMARSTCQTWGNVDDPQNTWPQWPHNGWSDLAEHLRIQLGTQQTIHVCESLLGCFSTCARAHPASISRVTAEPIALKFGM